MSSDVITPYEMTAIRVKLATALNLPAFAGEFALEKWIELVGGIVAQSRWPRDQWGIVKITHSPSASNSKGVRADVQFSCENLDVVTSIAVIPEYQGGFRAVLMYSNDVVVETSHPSKDTPLLDVIEKMGHEIRKCLVTAALKRGNS
ncbi:hypothetical protein [Polyangium sorediatum]|uniref:Uncharacterized protein n=1 Tax=Polyangium sorediatum TaxID=889274 RepID=A0ABT6P5J3_9BACT|nr:hypothetical protein [Polyangium sorediatum]MDI1435455.1 hypothetical protein [Polyangium sorediatum]